MQPAVPLQYEFQINGRTSLTVLGTGLHQSNLTTVIDVMNVNGESVAISDLNSGHLTSLKNAVKQLLIDIDSIPA